MASIEKPLSLRERMLIFEKAGKEDTKSTASTFKCKRQNSLNKIKSPFIAPESENNCAARETTFPSRVPTSSTSSRGSVSSRDSSANRAKPTVFDTKAVRTSEVTVVDADDAAPSPSPANGPCKQKDSVFEDPITNIDSVPEKRKTRGRKLVRAKRGEGRLEDSGVSSEDEERLEDTEFYRIDSGVFSSPDIMVNDQKRSEGSRSPLMITKPEILVNENAPVVNISDISDSLSSTNLNSTTKVCIVL